MEYRIGQSNMEQVIEARVNRSNNIEQVSRAGNISFSREVQISLTWNRSVLYEIDQAFME